MSVTKIVAIYICAPVGGFASVNGCTSTASPDASGTGNSAVMTPSPVPTTDGAASKPGFGVVTMMAFAVRIFIIVG